MLFERRENDVEKLIRTGVKIMLFREDTLLGENQLCKNMQQDETFEWEDTLGEIAPEGE